MANGTSPTIEIVAIEFARAFARAGVAALVYDHRNLGRSGGEPRCEINPWVRCRGYVDAIGYATSRPEIDAGRIGLWGDSYTSGQVLVVSACDARPRAIAAQCPVFGPTLPTTQPSAETLAIIKNTLLRGDVRRGTPETNLGSQPVVSFDPLSIPSLLAPVQALRWFIDYGGRPGSGWVNRATRVVPPTPVGYSPFLCARPSCRPKRC